MQFTWSQAVFLITLLPILISAAPLPFPLPTHGPALVSRSSGFLPPPPSRPQGPRPMGSRPHPPRYNAAPAQQAQNNRPAPSHSPRPPAYSESLGANNLAPPARTSAQPEQINGAAPPYSPESHNPAPPAPAAAQPEQRNGAAPPYSPESHNPVTPAPAAAQQAQDDEVPPPYSPEGRGSNVSWNPFGGN